MTSIILSFNHVEFLLPAKGSYIVLSPQRWLFALGTWRRYWASQSVLLNHTHFRDVGIVFKGPIQDKVGIGDRKHLHPRKPVLQKGCGIGTLTSG